MENMKVHMVERQEGHHLHEVRGDEVELAVRRGRSREVEAKVRVRDEQGEIQKVSNRPDPQRLVRLSRLVTGAKGTKIKICSHTWL